jgi:acetylornithine/N-succinyldiaminopimelate aminotransferase
MKPSGSSHLIANYGKRPFDVARGEGVYLYDTSGKRYLDFASGIAVNTIGHAHPAFAEALCAQVKRLVHVSNLFGIPEQERLAGRIVQRAGAGKILFCNSGAEANEALIKLARLHGRRLSDNQEGQRYTIITAENAFHGRTFGGMAATPQDKIQNGFRPMLSGFRHAPLNDIERFAALADDSVAAIFLETIQGEGGLHVADFGFLREIQALCKERNILFMLDEVQCGIGRSGHFFAFEEAGVKPDAIGMAKGLGGGYPIGAIWVSDPHADLFQPGSHGTTFGGAPLACAAAHAVLDAIENEHLLENVRSLAPDFHSSLKNLVNTYPHLLAEVRGRGFMVGLGLKVDAMALRDAALAVGLLGVPAGTRAFRLLPPLNVNKEQLESAITCMDQALSALTESKIATDGN